MICMLVAHKSDLACRSLASEEVGKEGGVEVKLREIEGWLGEAEC